MFLGYIHYFRALAIAFIVAGHAIDAFSWGDDATERALRIFVSNGSTLFVFIAGYLFQHLSPKYSPKSYFEAKLKNVILPYLIVSIPAIIVFALFIKRDGVWDGFYDNPVLLQVVLFYITGIHLAPLWFVPMIAIFYLVSPLLVYADKNSKSYYFLPLLIILSCLVNRGWPHESFVHFFSAYFLGMFFSRYKDRLNPIISKATVLFCALSAVLVFAAWEFYFSKGTMTYVNYLQKLSMSILFLGLFYRVNDSLDSRFISYIAEVSFGVFFVHSYFITGNKMMYEKLFQALPTGNLLVYALFALFTLLSCVLMMYLTKKLTGKNSRYLVGC